MRYAVVALIEQALVHQLHFNVGVHCLHHCVPAATNISSLINRGNCFA